MFELLSLQIGNAKLNKLMNVEYKKKKKIRK